MSKTRRVLANCFLTPIVLIGSCAGKMYVDARMYDLPGEVLRSKVAPTQSLDTAMQVAEALDAYVQPRFEILRDKNFGAIRVVYPKHAGIVQLKVDTAGEQRIIANVYATKRDYAICLLHCASLPDSGGYKAEPSLEPLYYNRDGVASSFDGGAGYAPEATATERATLDTDAWQKKATAALPELMAGREYRAADKSWAVLMRPVRASKQACLGCHTDAKPGATLGVMVYAVRQTQRGEPRQIGMR